MSCKPKNSETFEAWFAQQKFRNFKASELIWYFSKVRNGVKNTYPPRSLWHNLIPTLRILDDLRDYFGKPLNISSTYRALAYNRTIGSPDGSMHRKFNAVDFSVSDKTPAAVAAVLKQWRNQKKFTGGIGKYRTFVHLDTRNYNATW